MKNYVLLSIFCALSLALFSQQRINNSIPFLNDPSKDYSIYIPSTYNSNSPNKLMLGLHPLNTNRWDGNSWCDTLIDFAEANNLLLICPDGGSDGRIDDAIDTAFTSLLLDSMMVWYNVDPSQVYAMGFSWGARTTYTYGLSHVNKFGGFMPIGAAITRTNEVNVPLQNNATGKAFYIIHGSNDSPSIRFRPVRDSLISKGAIVNTKYLNGVGHTIDFPNRNSILTSGFLWIDSVNNAQLVSVQEIEIDKIPMELFPNPNSGKFTLNFESLSKTDSFSFELFDSMGRRVSQFTQQVNKGLNEIEIKERIANGSYILKVTNKESSKELKLIIEQ